jgi:hypothetical protein
MARSGHRRSADATDSLAELPGAYGGAAPYAAANALAAIAAARALGTSQQTVIDRLGAFDPIAHNPGRGALLRRATSRCSSTTRTTRRHWRRSCGRCTGCGAWSGALPR